MRINPLKKNSSNEVVLMFSKINIYIYRYPGPVLELRLQVLLIFQLLGHWEHSVPLDHWELFLDGREWRSVYFIAWEHETNFCFDLYFFLDSFLKIGLLIWKYDTLAMIRPTLKKYHFFQQAVSVIKEELNGKWMCWEMCVRQYVKVWYCFFSDCSECFDVVHTFHHKCHYCVSSFLADI